MGAVLVIITFPVVLMTILVVMQLAAELSIGAVAIGALLLTLLGGAIIGLLHYEWRAEVDGSIGEAPEAEPTDDEASLALSAATLRSDDAAMEELNISWGEDIDTWADDLHQPNA
jgi:hypothetical protein